MTISPGPVVLEDGRVPVPVPVERLLRERVRLGVHELGIGGPCGVLGELVLEQAHVVRVRRPGTGQPQPGLDDVRVDVEPAHVDRAGHPVAVVVVDGQPVLVDEEVVLDPLDLLGGEAPPSVGALHVRRGRDDVGDVVAVGTDQLVGLLGPQLRANGAGRPQPGTVRRTGLPWPAVAVLATRGAGRLRAAAG
jgi:hypothetical protein